MMKIAFQDHWGETCSAEPDPSNENRLRLGRDDGNRMLLEKDQALWLAVLLLNWATSGRCIS